MVLSGVNLCNSLCICAETSPDICSIEFLVDARGLLNADYVDSAYDGIRRALPFIDKTSIRPALRKAALPPTSERRTFRRDPRIWALEPIDGFWRYISAHSMQEDPNRQDPNAASGSHMGRRLGGRNRAAGMGFNEDTDLEPTHLSLPGNSNNPWETKTGDYVCEF